MIHIVDDEEPIRDSLAWLLRSRDLAARGFDSAESFLAYARDPATAADAPGCILLDVRMGAMTGIELFELLHAEARCTAWPTIFLTGHADVPMAVHALKIGAFDLVEKPFNDNSLVDRVQAALAESTRRLDHARTNQSVEQRLAALTPREREVMDCILAGHYNKVIAEHMGIAMRTVEVYRARILAKMGVKTAVELAALVATRRADG